MVQTDFQGAVALAVHLPITGIIPLVRPLYKSPFDRVAVDVADTADGRGMGKDIAIITAAILPEAQGFVLLSGR